MKQSSAFRRGLSALVALVLMVGMVFGQNFVIGGSATISNSGNLNVKGNITNNGKATATSFGGTVTMNGSGAQSIGTSTFGDINFATLTNSSGNTVTLNVGSTVSTAIDVTASTTFAVAASQTLTLQGTVTQTSGSYTFNNSGSTVDYAGGAQTVIGTTYANLTTSAAGNKTMNNNATVNSALTLTDGALVINGNLLTIGGSIATTSGTLTGSATSDISFTGTGDATLPSVSGGLENLTVNRTGPTDIVTLGANLTLAGALTLTDGELAVSTTTLTLQAGVSAASGTLTSSSTGTVDYAQSTDGQAVLAANYGNLTFSNNNKTLPSGTLGVAATFTPGSATGHTVTGSTFDFNGAGQNLPSFNGATGYLNLTTSGSGTKTATGNIVVGGAFDNGNSITTNMGTNTLAITGAKDNTAGTMQFGGASNGVLFTTGTVEYNGTDQTITGHASDTYATLLLSNSGTKTVATGAGNTVHTTGAVSVGSGITLDIVAGGILTVESTLTVDGTFSNAGTVTVGL